MEMDRLICQQHGWLGHLGIHEAGHATAAILLDFEFVEVFIKPGNHIYEQMVLGKQIVGAGVQMPTEQPAEWVGPRPEDALVYLLAGSISEKELSGHWLPGGYQGDIEMWRRGTGRSEGQNKEQVEELKPLMKEGIERAQKLVGENRAAILRVYGLMLERVPNNGHHHTGFDEPLILSYDEVRAAVLATP